MTLIVLSAVALSCISASAQENATRLVLNDIRLIDGSGRPAVDHVSILIEGGKIAQIVNTSTAAKWPSDTQVLQLAGKTVMPGLIAGHAHLGLTKAASVSPENYTTENIEQQLAQYERYGVMTMISLGLNQDLLYQLRSSQEKGQLPGTTVLTADRGIGTPGGVPALNIGPNQVYRPATPEEARAEVREMAARDANLLKIWVDDNLHKLPMPNPAIAAAVIEEAHRQKLRVAAHVYYLSDAKRLVEQGVDILAHSVRDKEIDPDTISLIKSHHVFYIPTLQLEESFFVYADHPAWMDTPFFQNAVNPDFAKILNSSTYKQKTQQDETTPIHRAALNTAMTNLMKLRHADVLIGFGTDSGANPYRIQGFAEHRELQLMVQAGMTPMDAIHRATSVNAEMLQIDKKTGTIEVGKQADLIVLNADPSTDISNTEKIAMVFHNGRIVR